jgi:hypothetical protein
VTGAIVPVGHYLGLVHDDSAGQARHRVRVGRESEPMDTPVEAAVWFAAHGYVEMPRSAVWTRQQVLDAVPEMLGADLPGTDAAFAALLRDGLLVEVDDGFADRYRVVPLTFGTGWRHGEDGLAVGSRQRAVSVDETAFAVWERGAEFPTLRAACADAAAESPDAALDAVLTDLHRMLAVSAVYVDVAVVDSEAAASADRSR